MEKTKKVYLSGKITGDDNYKVKFGEYALQLKKQGYNVINPTLLSQLDFLEYEDYMTIDFAMIKVCDVIAMLPDWQESLGAIRELNYAKCLRKEIMYL